MTPAVNVAKKAKVSHQIHQYEHDPSAPSYGLEAAEKLGVSADSVFKTLVVSTDKNELAVGIIPVTAKLSMKLMAKATHSKKTGMAEQSDVERATGYVLGGVSPLGQKKRLPTIIHSSA